jgi:hypothetical protein
MLYPSFFKNAAFAVLVGVAEFPICTIGDDLYFTMGMERPDSTGRERIVIEDPQCPEFHMIGVVVVAKGKMPAAVKGAIHYFPIDLIDAFRLPYDYLMLCRNLLFAIRHGYAPYLSVMC